MNNIVIFGDTPFAERISKYIQIENIVNVIAFTQEKKYLNRNSINGIPVVPYEDLNSIHDDFSILIAIGYGKMNLLREKIYRLCKKDGFKIATYKSSTSTIYTSEIGEGSIILPGTHIGPGCKIGICNIFESSCAIAHDNIFGDFNFFSVNVVIGGHARVENHCFLGLNSTIKNSLIIPDYTIVGSAANVIKISDETNGVYVGNPAKILPNRKSLDVVVHI